MIEARDLTKNYGSIRALRGVSFDIGAGEVVGLLGPNGAGKSTAMRIATGYLAPTSGSITVSGMEVLDDPRSVQALIGYLPEGNPLYLEMRLREALQFVASIRGLSGDARRKAIGAALDDAGLLGREHQIISSFSRGFRQRVGLAMALLSRPPILILDEPTSGLDPNQQIEMRKFIRSLAEDHTVVFSSHILPEVEAVCDRILVIHQGRLVADGTVDSIRRGATGGRTVALAVRGRADAARLAFEALPFGDVLECDADPFEPTLTRLRLSIADLDDIEAREVIVKTAYEAGLGLVQVDVERATLEQAFAALTPDHEDDVGREMGDMTVPPPIPEPASVGSEDPLAEKGGDDVA